MPPTPWQSFAKPDQEKEYTVLLSFLPLNGIWKLPKFLSHAFRIRKQLGRSEGLIGYSLLARFITLHFFTLSVWESEKALMQFARAIPHGKAMSALQGDFGGTRFIRWKLKGDAMPPGWEDALKRFDTRRDSA